MANLKTDYKDDILDSTQNLRRKFRMITNDDGTFSFEDVTDYLQYGDNFGAFDLNAITNAIMNECLKRTDVVDNLESTATKLPLSANMGRELKENLSYKKIYTNNNPSTISAGTLVSDIGDYDYIDIVCIYNASSITFKINRRIFKESTTQVVYITQTSANDIVFLNRNVSYGNGKIMLDNCTSNVQGMAQTIVNDCILPVEIYGGYVN